MRKITNSFRGQNVYFDLIRHEWVMKTLKFWEKMQTKDKKLADKTLVNIHRNWQLSTVGFNFWWIFYFRDVSDNFRIKHLEFA